MWIHSTSLCSTLPNAPPSTQAIRAMQAKDHPDSSKSLWKGSVCGEFNNGLYFIFCLLRFPTGLGIKESDTRKTLVSSKRKPTCTLRELPSMRLMHPHTEAKQIHPQLQTLQVRQEVPGSAKLFDMYLLSVHHYS